MSRPEMQLELDLWGKGAEMPSYDVSRREPRDPAVRIVEYAPFPRVDPGQRTQVGFTRDLSQSGMCLGLDAAEPVGALLRVVVRALDGQPARVSIGRVVWCSPDADTRYWHGLELLTGGRAIRSTRAGGARAAHL